MFVDASETYRDSKTMTRRLGEACVYLPTQTQACVYLPIRVYCTKKPVHMALTLTLSLTHLGKTLYDWLLSTPLFLSVRVRVRVR